MCEFSVQNNTTYKSVLFCWKNNSMWYHENNSKFEKNYKKSQHCSVAQVTLSYKYICLCHLSRRIQILNRRKWDVLFNLTQSFNINQAIMTPPLGGIVTHEEKWFIILIMNFSSSFQSGPESFIFNDPEVFREMRGSPSDHLSYSAVCFPAWGSFWGGRRVTTLHCQTLMTSWCLKTLTCGKKALSTWFQ